MCIHIKKFELFLRIDEGQVLYDLHVYGHNLAQKNVTKVTILVDPPILAITTCIYLVCLTHAPE